MKSLVLSAVVMLSLCALPEPVQACGGGLFRGAFRAVTAPARGLRRMRMQRRAYRSGRFVIVRQVITESSAVIEDR